MANQKETAMNTTVVPAEGKIEAQTPTTPGAAASLWASIRRFIREVQVELKKTIWPSQNELTKNTVVVLATIFCVAVFLYVADTVIAAFATWAFKL